MPNQIEQRYPRRLIAHGGSALIAIPAKIRKALGWHIGNYLVVRQEGSEVVVSWSNLNPDNEITRQHYPVPKGSKGEYLRRENREEESQRGPDNPLLPSSEVSS